MSEKRELGWRALGVVGVMLGLVLVLAAFMILTTWEVHLFRATTQDMDFTERVCGTPFDNPGWARGDPCDGAVNRQFAGGVALLVLGVGLIMSPVAVAAGRRSSHADKRDA